MQVTEDLCRAIVNTTFDSLPPQVIQVAKQVILDGLAVAVAGSTEEGSRIVADHVQSLGGVESSTVLGFRFKTSPVWAAYVNGVSMHVLDYEPMWSPPTHATSPTLPVVRALAEVEGLPGSEVIAAFVKGCEVQGRIRLASQQYTPAQLKYHPPGIVGVMGAAVASAHLLGLGLDQLRGALGIAASRAGGLMANVGTMAKSTHCGLAAAWGLDATLLSKRGFTGNTQVFEDPNGYVEVFFAEGFDFSVLLGFGCPYRMVDPGFAIKLFPSQYATHFGITAAFELRRAILDPGELVSVRIKTPVMPYVDRPLPRTGLEGKFSFQYTVAAALLDGSVTIRTFSDERRFRQDMVRLLPKISVIQSDEVSGQLEKMSVEVAVELRSGQCLTAKCNGPKGFWGLPRLGRDEHLVKVRDCLGMRLAKNEVERCIELIDRLDQLGSKEVRELIEMAGCFSQEGHPE
jgi:aconitate decarboxylase